MWHRSRRECSGEPSASKRIREAAAVDGSGHVDVVDGRAGVGRVRRAGNGQRQVPHLESPDLRRCRSGLSEQEVDPVLQVAPSQARDTTLHPIGMSDRAANSGSVARWTEAAAGCPSDIDSGAVVPVPYRGLFALRRNRCSDTPAGYLGKKRCRRGLPRHLGAGGVTAVNSSHCLVARRRCSAQTAMGDRESCTCFSRRHHRWSSRSR